MSLANFVTKISPFGTGFIACTGELGSWVKLAEKVKTIGTPAELQPFWLVTYVTDAGTFAQKFKAYQGTIYLEGGPTQIS